MGLSCLLSHEGVGGNDFGTLVSRIFDRLPDHHFGEGVIDVGEVPRDDEIHAGYGGDGDVQCVLGEFGRYAMPVKNRLRSASASAVV